MTTPPPTLPPPAPTPTPPPPVGPPPPADAVRIRRLTKRYGSLAAVDHLDLDVPSGGVFGLVGPNGAGKTTTMLAVVTLLQPDEGDIEVFGHDPRTAPREVRRLVGYIPDTFGLYDGLTCEEYLDFFASAYEVPRDQRREQVDALLELVELDHKRDTDVSGLSRGMQQRMSLARALVNDPQLVVADEPASGLDPRARVELREILRELSAGGVTVLISSHILAELDELCDRVAIIEAGTVLAQGTPDEIRTVVGSIHAVTIRVLGGEDALAAAAQVATAHSGAAVAIADGRLRCELPGGDEAAAELLAALVAAGIRVIDFREDQVGLERLFLSVTQGIVR